MAITIIIPLAMAATLYTGRIGQTVNASGDNAAGPQKKIRVVTSFYPLYEFARNVAGERAEVLNIMPAGIEPHDWEPNLNDILKIESANLIVINGVGLEAWARDIDAAKFIVDTSEGIDLIKEADYKGQEQAGTSANPHIWLDPVLAERQVSNIRDAIVKVDPANSDYYTSNANKYIAKLDSLDRFIKRELSTCKKSDFIPFHNAFSYFAKRYGLEQHSIHGLSPEGEILPQKLKDVIQLADNLGISVVYTEELADPRLADVIASEIQGGRVMTLSPIENLDRHEIASNVGYVDKMEQNVLNLKEGLDCSK